jgi:transcriptional regulator with XRE-family HTH domain
MDFIRIGEKLISRERVIHMVDRILERRAAGESQQEAANELGVDRSFVSRLETLGEIRKGGKVALIGFPVSNKAELEEVCQSFGVDYCLLLTDQERWQLANESSGTDLINQLMQLMATIRSYDTVIFIGSNMRIHLAEALTDKQLISINIGESPIQGDRYVDPEVVSQILEGLRSVSN